MKKSILLGLVLSSLLPIRAQGIGIVVGLKGGVPADSYFGMDYWSSNADNALGISAKLGFAAGVFCTVEVWPWLALQPELLLVQAGNAATQDALYWGPYEGTVRNLDVLTYLSVPLLVKFRMRSTTVEIGADARVRIGSGVARLTSSDKTLRQTFEVTGLDALRYPDDRFAPFVVAAVLGLEFGLPFRVLGGEWSLETRAEYGVTNVLGDSQGSVYNALEIAVMANCGLRVMGTRASPSKRAKPR